MKKLHKQNMTATITKVGTKGYEVNYFDIDNDKVVRYISGNTELEFWKKELKSNGHNVIIK